MFINLSKLFTRFMHTVQAFFKRPSELLPCPI